MKHLIHKKILDYLKGFGELGVSAIELEKYAHTLGLTSENLRRRVRELQEGKLKFIDRPYVRSEYERSLNGARYKRYWYIPAQKATQEEESLLIEALK